jgi:hypothetical protein
VLAFSRNVDEDQPLVCMRIHTEGIHASISLSVLVLNDPPARESAEALLRPGWERSLQVGRSSLTASETVLKAPMVSALET